MAATTTFSDVLQSATQQPGCYSAGDIGSDGAGVIVVPAKVVDETTVRVAVVVVAGAVVLTGTVELDIIVVFWGAATG